MADSMTASYIKLLKSGELKQRVEAARQILTECTLCPRECRVNRLKGKLGFCASADKVMISSYGLHHGEEPPISGQKGSGTIFFTGCNLRCLFCQNYRISQLYEGHEITLEDIAKAMLALESQGAHNINLVSPTHFVPQILEALLIAAEKGLELPIVYNTNGYDSIETLKLLDGIVDIYLPDIKYSDDKYAKAYSGVADYVKHNRVALKEMYRQVGDLKLNNPPHPFPPPQVGRVGEGVVETMCSGGVAERGVIIRHLVLPLRGAGSFASLDFIRNELSKDAFVSLMSQYHPCYKAKSHPILSRRLLRSEYDEVVDYAGKLGLDNCYVQELVSSDDWLPDFSKDEPFNRSH